MSKNKITLNVQSLSGNFTDEFNLHQTLQHVMDKAFKELNIVPSPGEVWQLRYNNVVLTLGHTIEQADLPDGATLTLAPVEGGGGAQWILK